MIYQQIAAINAVLFFFIWLVVLYAGADHPPPPGFILVVLLDLIAAFLVYWRVPYYLDWISTGQSHRLLWVVRDGLVGRGGLCGAGVTGESYLWSWRAGHHTGGQGYRHLVRCPGWDGGRECPGDLLR